MLGDADGAADDRERGVDRADGGHERAVDHVQVVQVVGLAVEVQGRHGRVGAEADRARRWAVAATLRPLCR